jgi:uncharacterized protein (TIGR03663 family)
MNRWVAFGVLLITGVALALRCPKLDERPMHNDEGVNALKFGELWKQGSYKYDPTEYHGPALPYATLLIGKLSGAPAFTDYSERRLRAVTIIFGVGLIFILPLFHDALGKRGLLWSGLGIAVSNAFVFYSRYYIHEMLLVFFTLLALAGAWRYWRSRKWGWAVLAGAATGLMQASKETFLFSVCAAGGAIILNHLWNRYLDASGKPVPALPLRWRDILLAAIACFFVWLSLFSSFGTNTNGLVDSFRTYAAWFARTGHDSPQLQPWSFYLQRLLCFHAPRGPIWSEALILVLAAVGCAAAFLRKTWTEGSRSFARFVAFYSVLLTLVYSAIPYKTPWCLLNFWLGFILLAGVGAATLVQLARYQWAQTVARIALVAGFAQLAAQAWKGGIEYASDQWNPYVYAQTLPDVLDLVKQVELRANARDSATLTAQVVATDGDYWPLPWYLRRVETGWYDSVPPILSGDVIIASPKFGKEIEATGAYEMNGFYGFRPQVVLGLFVKKQ